MRCDVLINSLVCIVQFEHSSTKIFKLVEFLKLILLKSLTFLYVRYNYAKDKKTSRSTEKMGKAMTDDEPVKIKVANMQVPLGDITDYDFYLDLKPP